MADAPVVHIGENSPERVAYDLMLNIAYTEKIRIGGGPTGNSAAGSGDKPPDRKWILDAYAECLQAVRGDRQLLKD